MNLAELFTMAMMSSPIEHLNMEHLPAPYSGGRPKVRPVRIKMRRREGIEIQPQYEWADGAVAFVTTSWIMPVDDHSVYGGERCWDVERPIGYGTSGRALPLYLSENDFEWVGE